MPRTTPRKQPRLRHGPPIFSVRLSSHRQRGVSYSPKTVSLHASIPDRAVIVTAKLIRGTIGALLIAALASGLAACSNSSSQTQTGPSPVKCQVSLSTSSTPPAARGGARSVAVTTQPECAWTASADVTWIGGLSPASGQGD